MYRQPENNNRVKYMRNRFEKLDSDKNKNEFKQNNCNDSKINNNDDNRRVEKSESIEEDTDLGLTRQLSDPSKRGCIKRTPAFRKEKQREANNRQSELSFATKLSMFEETDGSSERAEAKKKLASSLSLIMNRAENAGQKRSSLSPKRLKNDNSRLVSPSDVKVTQIQANKSTLYTIRSPPSPLSEIKPLINNGNDRNQLLRDDNYKSDFSSPKQTYKTDLQVQKVTQSSSKNPKSSPQRHLSSYEPENDAEKLINGSNFGSKNFMDDDVGSKKIKSSPRRNPSSYEFESDTEKSLVTNSNFGSKNPRLSPRKNQSSYELEKAVEKIMSSSYGSKNLNDDLKNSKSSPRNNKTELDSKLRVRKNLELNKNTEKQIHKPEAQKSVLLSSKNSKLNVRKLSSTHENIENRSKDPTKSRARKSFELDAEIEKIILDSSSEKTDSKLNFSTSPDFKFLSQKEIEPIGAKVSNFSKRSLSDLNFESLKKNQPVKTRENKSRYLDNDSFANTRKTSVSFIREMLENETNNDFELKLSEENLETKKIPEYAQVNKPKRKQLEITDNLTDTLKAALKQPLPIGPPPKKPPRTFAHTPRNNGEKPQKIELKSEFSDKLNELVSSHKKEPEVKTKIKSDPKLMLQKLENALLSNRIRSPKLPKKLKNPVENGAKAQNLMPSNDYTTEPQKNNVLPNCLASLNCSTARQSYSQVPTLDSKSTFFVPNSREEPIYAEPFEYQVKESPESSSKFSTISRSVHYLVRIFLQCVS